jgi:RHS repeat-associated protein
LPRPLPYFLALLLFLLTGWFPASGRLTYQTDTSFHPPSAITHPQSPQGTIDLTYNPDGHRLTKLVSQSGLTQRLHHYLTDPNNPTGYSQVVEEKDPLAPAAEQLKKVHLYGHDLIATSSSQPSTPNPQLHFYTYDGLGSVRGITDESGDLQETYDYDAYGTLIGLAKRNATSGELEPSSPISNPQSPISSEHLFCGEQWDSDLGMYFLRARYLNTNTGRFHTQDTYEGRNGEPLTLHKYLYVHGNPVMGTDPSGRVTMREVSATLGLVVGFIARHALVINRTAIFAAEVAGVPTIGIGAGAYVAKESAVSKLPSLLDDISAAVARLSKGRFSWCKIASVKVRHTSDSGHSADGA